MAKRHSRSPLLPLAILVVLLAGGFTVNDGVFRWYWGQAPWVAALLLVVGLALGAAFFLQRSRRVGS